MAYGQGTAVIDFGGFPGTCEVSVTVTGQTEIAATSKVEAFFMADDTTTDHTAEDHRWAALLVGLSCGNLQASEGFTIYATTLEELEGTFQVRWVWAD